MHDHNDPSFDLISCCWRLCLWLHVSCSFHHRLWKYRRYVRHEAASLAYLLVGLRNYIRAAHRTYLWLLYRCQIRLVSFTHLNFKPSVTIRQEVGVLHCRDRDGRLDFPPLFVKESRQSQLLASRLALVQKATGMTYSINSPYHTLSLATFTKVALRRPIRLFFTEPIVFVVSIMSATGVSFFFASFSDTCE